MFGRTTLRVRIVALPLLPALVLGVVVGFDLHRSPATIIAAIVATVLGVTAAFFVVRSIARPLKDLATIVLDLNDLRSIDGSGLHVRGWPVFDLPVTSGARVGSRGWAWSDDGLLVAVPVV